MRRQISTDLRIGNPAIDTEYGTIGGLICGRIICRWLGWRCTVQERDEPPEPAGTYRPTTSAWRTQQETTVTSPSPRSGKVEAIEIHDLVPRGHEVAHELLPGVVARVDLRECAELGVRTEDQIDA